MEFCVVPHSVLQGETLVECRRDGKLVACVYPHSEGLRIISRYMTGVVNEGGHVPSVVISLGDKPVV